MRHAEGNTGNEPVDILQPTGRPRTISIRTTPDESADEESKIEESQGEGSTTAEDFLTQTTSSDLTSQSKTMVVALPTLVPDHSPTKAPQAEPAKPMSPGQPVGNSGDGQATDEVQNGIEMTPATQNTAPGHRDKLGMSLEISPHSFPDVPAQTTSGEKSRCGRLRRRWTDIKKFLKMCVN